MVITNVSYVKTRRSAKEAQLGHRITLSGQELHFYMATQKIVTQNYPRIDKIEDSYEGYLDDSKLFQHHQKVALEKVYDIIKDAIKNASQKSSREILDIREDATESQIDLMLHNKGSELFKYFVKYCGDPAATAVDCVGRNYKDVASEQFHNRTLQMERMNSGWRYQFIAKNMAIESKRFDSISDAGTKEADFNVTIKTLDNVSKAVTLYVSVKNRTNTMGGQDWPKAITALENLARTDKNLIGPYLCVFGIAMEHGLRSIKRQQSTGAPYSVNTEVWLSDYFWPFFTNYSYLEIISEVVRTLQEVKGSQRLDVNTNPILNQLFESFKDSCNSCKLLDDDGQFKDSQLLAELFVMGIKKYKEHYGL